jgi:hypothetical protein
MFQQRQLNDLYQLMEVSFTTSVTPGTLTAGTAGRVTGVACSIAGNSANPALLTLGDALEIVAPAGANGRWCN